jgi:CheY-like chemotaxis protein
MSKAHLLLVDDTPQFVVSRKKILENAGYEVQTADTPEAARQILRDRDVHVDLAIIDLRLRDGGKLDRSGLDLAREFPRVPRLICTMHDDDARAVAAAAGLGVEVVFKDYPDDLLKGIRRALKPQIFLAHGRDAQAMNNVKQELEDRLKLGVIVLAEQTGGGRSILEKLEENSRVEFAVVILTPDDMACEATPEIAAGRSKPEYTLRARQNVIFELGFFIGRLGRKHVFVLCKGDVEIPSDYRGIGFISLNGDEDWRRKLAQELSAAGLDIDPERL